MVLLTEPPLKILLEVAFSLHPHMFHTVTTAILSTHVVTTAATFGATTATFATDLVDSGGELASGGHVVIPDPVS